MVGLGTTTVCQMEIQVPVCICIHGAIHYLSSATDSACFDLCAYKTVALYWCNYQQYCCYKITNLL